MAQAQLVREVMTGSPVTVAPNATITEAARLMRDDDIGDVLLTENGHIMGIVTDRDITIRSTAEGRDPNSTTVKDICTTNVTTLAPSSSIDEAIRLMRERSVRRLPVTEGDQPVGVVSLGDLAIERDANSVLGNISAAPANA